MKRTKLGPKRTLPLEGLLSGVERSNPTRNYNRQECVPQLVSLGLGVEWRIFGKASMPIASVSQHRGSMCALVEADLAHCATEIAKAHREAKRVFSGHPSREVLEDRYDVALATEGDVAWARKFGAGVFTDMPAKPRKTAVRSRKGFVGSAEGAGVTKAA